MSLKESRRAIEPWNPWTPQDCSEKCGHPEKTHKGHFQPFIVSGEITTGIRSCEFFWLNITKGIQECKFFAQINAFVVPDVCKSRLVPREIYKKNFQTILSNKNPIKFSSSQFTWILSQNVKLSCFCHLKIGLIWSVVESLVLFSAWQSFQQDLF